MAREIWDQNDAATHAPVKIERGKAAARSVDHTFTHFRLELSVVRATAEGSSNVDGIWVTPDRLGEHALPTLMKKVARFALASG